MSPSARRAAVHAALKEGPKTIRELGERVSLDHTALLLALHQLMDEGLVARAEIDNWRARRAGQFTYKLVGEEQ